MCVLGFQELPGLSTEDYVTLSIVKQYLDFKVKQFTDREKSFSNGSGMERCASISFSILHSRELRENTDIEEEIPSLIAPKLDFCLVSCEVTVR